MDFKIKIDLSSQSIINETPQKEKKQIKRKKEKSETTEIKEKTIEKSRKREDHNEKRKYKKREKKVEKEVEKEKPKINLSSIISLTLPHQDTSKGDQAQKLALINKKKPRHWERRWVLIPNVFEFTKEIWLKKWVLVDGGEDIVDSNVI